MCACSLSLSLFLCNMSVKKRAKERRMMMAVGKMCAEKNYWQRRQCSEKRRRNRRKIRRRSNNTTIVEKKKNQKHRNDGGGSVSEAVPPPCRLPPPLCWSSTSLISHQSNQHNTNKNCFNMKWKWLSLLSLKENFLLLNNNQQILFHPQTSSSTQIVLADRPLPLHGKFYWEMFVPAVYGTSMMFGIATREQKLVSPMFENLLGADQHGWGLSHHGLAWHNGISNSFLSQPMETLQSVLIGLHFDADLRTLSYTINNQYLGIAFHSIPNDQPIYPAVSSTSAQSTIILRHCCQICSSLREICLKSIKSRIKVNMNCQQLLPHHLITQLMT